MRDKIFGFLKGVCKSMVNASNKTAEVIDSAKNAIIEISEHKESKFSNIVRDHDISTCLDMCNIPLIINENVMDMCNIPLIINENVMWRDDKKGDSFIGLEIGLTITAMSIYNI